MSGTDQLLRATIEKYFGTSADEYETILQSLQTVSLDGGAWLFRQGDLGDSLYFLVRGRLQVWNTPDEDGAAPLLLGEIVPGGSVGEISLLTGANRSAGVRAIRDSQLVRVGRAEFEALARRHPTLAMQVAGSVARVLRDRSSRSASTAANFKTIAVVRLSEGPREQKFCSRLDAALGRYGTTVSLSPSSLASLGAPANAPTADQALPDELRHWLHDRENDSRFVIYQCEPDATPWSIFAIQQSDLVLLVVDAATDPVPGPGEARLAAATGESNARRMLVLLQPDSTIPIAGTAAWLAPRRIDFHFHVRADVPDEPARVARVISGKAVGLVLSAGAARGFAHLGVYKALVEAGIQPDWIGGASMGAVMGAVLASGDDPDASIARTRLAFSKTNPFGDFTIPLFSLLRGRRFERMLRENFKADIEDLPIPFYAVSCNLDSGALNLHDAGSLPTALRASAAMAGVMPPAVVNQQLAVDGVVIDSMPVDIMQTKPVGRIVAVDLSSQKSYLVPFTSLPSPWAVLRGRLFPWSHKYRVPTLMTLLLKATEVGTMARVRELGSRADLLLNPPVREFGMMDLKAFDRIVEAGYRYGQTAVAEWLAGQQPDDPGR